MNQLPQSKYTTAEVRTSFAVFCTSIEVGITFEVSKYYDRSRSVLQSKYVNTAIAVGPADVVRFVARTGSNRMEELEAPRNCPHAHTAYEVQDTPFFKRSFAAEVAVCQDCRQTLWTEHTRAQFSEWVKRLKREHREVFQVQFYLTKAAQLGLEVFLIPYPGVPKSTLIRALTTVYLSSLVRLPSFAAMAREMIEHGSYRALAFGPRRKTSLQISPMAMLELQSRSDALKLSPHKIVEDAILKLLALSQESDRQLWDHELKPQLDLILRST